MTIDEYVAEWRASGVITPEQAETASALARKERFSVFLELNALLYVGVLAFAAGVGWTIKAHFANLGDVAVLVTLTALFAAALAYCFTQSAAFSPAQVPSPTFAFDYVLYLGCLVFAAELSYIEFRFALLRTSWDAYLLLSATLYFVLAYRFDNRFVLSLALSTLALWFGVRLTTFALLAGSYRGVLLAYGLIVAVVGIRVSGFDVKRHFLSTYLHVAANAVLGALASGTAFGGTGTAWLIALVAACAAVAERGIRFRRFAFVAYAVLYGYVGLTGAILPHVKGASAALSYFVFSGAGVGLGLFILARRFGREI